MLKDSSIIASVIYNNSCGLIEKTCYFILFVNNYLEEICLKRIVCIEVDMHSGGAQATIIETDDQLSGKIEFEKQRRTIAGRDMLYTGCRKGHPLCVCMVQS